MAYQFKVSEERSRLMSKIRSNNTSPEVAFRKKLWGLGIRFARKNNGLLGKPDVIIKKYRIVVFIDGEFWHGYKWEEKKKTIKSNRDYWIPKIEKNIARDLKYKRELTRMGWKVVRFWQKEIDKDIGKCASKIKKLVEKRKI